MSEIATFTLVPFEPLPKNIALTVTGTVTREGNRLSIAYLMAGDLEAIALPPLVTSSDRRDRLWEQTCFEFFLAAGSQKSDQRKSDQDAYWEFNLSPTGAWNIFALSGYRKGLHEESAFSELPFSVSRDAEGLSLSISVEVDKLLPADVPWRLGVSTVGVLQDGAETFWAISHPGATADFHSAGSFALQL